MIDFLMQFYKDNICNKELEVNLLPFGCGGFGIRRGTNLFQT